MPDQLKAALIKSIPDLGNALSAPRPRVIDCGVINSLEEAKQAAASTLDCGEILSPETPQDPVEQKVLAFLKVCHVTAGMTAREISGGSSQPISDVAIALNVLVQKGAVTVSDEPQTNYRRYSLPGTPLPASAPTGPALSPAEQWALDARKRADAEAAANRPAEPKRFEPSEEAITAELEKRKSIQPLSAEEREILRLTEGRIPRSPQAFIKR